MEAFYWTLMTWTISTLIFSLIYALIWIWTESPWKALLIMVLVILARIFYMFARTVKKTS